MTKIITLSVQKSLCSIANVIIKASEMSSITEVFQLNVKNIPMIKYGPGITNQSLLNISAFSLIKPWKLRPGLIVVIIYCDIRMLFQLFHVKCRHLSCFFVCFLCCYLTQPFQMTKLLQLFVQYYNQLCKRWNQWLVKI